MTKYISMKKLQVLSDYSEEFKREIKYLSVDGEIFDWGMDLDSLAEAKKVISQHRDLAESVSMSIINHFLESFSDFIGQQISLRKLLDSIEKGFIE